MLGWLVVRNRPTPYAVSTYPLFPSRVLKHKVHPLHKQSPGFPEPSFCLARPSNQTRGFIFPSDGSLEKAMATHSSTLAWKLPWMEEPGRLRSMGSLSQTRLTDFTLTFHFHALEKEMAIHSSVLAWRIPGMGEPGGLPSMGSQESDTTEVT